MRAAWLAAGIACAVLIAASSVAAPQYTYDQLGRIQSATYDNGVQILYNYDAAGNRTTVTRASGNNLSPVAIPCSATTFGTQPVNCNVLQNSYSPQGYQLSISAVGASSCGTTSINSPNVTYQLNASGPCGANYIGPDSFTYTVNDNHGHTAYATVFISVQAVTPPIANSDAAQTAQNTTVVIPALANDVEPIQAYKPYLEIYSVASPTPAGGTASRVNNNTQIQYIPAPSYVGMDSFLYTDTDQHGQYGSGTITVQVGSPPVAVNDIMGTAANTAVSYNPLLNDTDPYGFPISILAVTQPSNGTVTQVNNAIFNYVPNSGFGSTTPQLDTFTYTITDGHLNSNAATENICVGIQAPTANNLTMPAVGYAPYQGGNYVTGKKNVGGTISCGQAPIAAVIATQAQHGTASSDGTYVYWTSAQKMGEGIYNNYDSFTYTLTDPYGQVSQAATVTVNVTVICNSHCP